MTRARWWVLAALGLLTVTIVTLDATGVIFDPAPVVAPPVPLLFADPLGVDPAVTPVDASSTTQLPPNVERAIERSLADKDLGPRVAATIVASSGDVLYSQGPARPSTPASTLKLLTALSVLDVFPSTKRLETSVVAGDQPDVLVLRGGGDATLTVDPARGDDPASASLTELARATSKALGESPVRLRYDTSLFTGPSVSPSWEPTYVSSGVIAPVTALMADQGLISDTGLSRYPNPAAAAAADFARLLEAEGVAVQGRPSETTARPTPESIAAVQSPPMGLLVERMLRDSDNQLAEALGRLAAIERGLPGSFDGAVDAMGMAADARDLQIDTGELHDASGLSRDDLVPAAALAGVLRNAVKDAALRPITTGLPVAGFDGTLIDRYLVPPQHEAAGVIRAKTGTLTGVSAESGMAVTCKGSLVLFAFVADRVPYDTDAARDALDQAAAALTRCP